MDGLEIRVTITDRKPDYMPLARWILQKMQEETEMPEEAPAIKEME